MSGQDPREGGQADGAEAVDLAEALEQIGGDGDLLREIGGIYLGVYPGQLEELDSCLAAGDGEQASRGAHRIKGAVASFCCEQAVDAAHTIERAAREGDLSGAREARPALDRALEALAAALRAFGAVPEE